MPNPPKVGGICFHFSVFKYAALLGTLALEERGWLPRSLQLWNKNDLAEASLTKGQLGQQCAPPEDEPEARRGLARAVSDPLYRLLVEVGRPRPSQSKATQQGGLFLTLSVEMIPHLQKSCKDSTKNSSICLHSYLYLRTFFPETSESTVYTRWYTFPKHLLIHRYNAFYL